MNVTFTDNTKVANYVGCSRSKHIIIRIRKRLRRCYNNRVSSVNTQRVKVLFGRSVIILDLNINIKRSTYFHVTNSNTIIHTVSYNFIFNFFPTFHTTFNQDLRAQAQTLCFKITKFIRVVCKTGTESTESKCRTKNNRVTNLLSCIKCSIDR